MTEEKKKSLREKAQTLKTGLKRLQRLRELAQKKVDKMKARLKLAESQAYKAYQDFEAGRTNLKRLEEKLECCRCNCEKCEKSESWLECCDSCRISIGRRLDALSHPRGCDCIIHDGSRAHP